MKAVSRTHIGKVRSSNQDALLIVPGVYGVYGVADGMGGHKAGDVASRLAVSQLEKVLKGKRPTESMLRGGIESANRVIYDAQMQNTDYSGMGTTMTVIWEGKKRVLLGHVGDSRAYFLRDGILEQISQDHSMVAELVRDGLLTPEEARVHPYRNIITRALGASEGVMVDTLQMDKEVGDRYLICSDGLSEYVPDEKMREILTEMDLEEAADLLLSLALDGGGRDNISLVKTEVTA